MSTGHASAAARHAQALLARQDAPSADRGDAAQRQVAWQREMERAQMANWFKPPLAADRAGMATPPDRPPETPARHAKPDAVPAAGAVVGSPSAAAGWLPAMAAEAVAAGLRAAMAAASIDASPVPHAAVGFVPDSRSALAAPPAGEAPPIAQLQARRGGANLPPAAGEPATGDTTDAQAAASTEAQAPSSPSSDDQAPLRLHEESMPEGRAVWIAMRADDAALAAMLPRIVVDLQRGTQDRGERLHQVVCNGRLVWRADVAVPAAGDTSVPRGNGRPGTVDSFHSKGA